MTNKEAIEWLQDIKETGTLTDWAYDVAINMAIEALKQEPKREHWQQAKDVEIEYAVCTNCKHHGEFYMDYCPNCGARMELKK